MNTPLLWRDILHGCGGPSLWAWGGVCHIQDRGAHMVCGASCDTIPHCDMSFPECQYPNDVTCLGCRNHPDRGILTIDTHRAEPCFIIITPDWVCNTWKIAPQ